MVECFEKYLYQKVNIHGLDTYILAPEKYDELLEDEEALNNLPIHRALVELVKGDIRTAKTVKNVKLYVAICHNNHVPKPFWLPVHCMEKDGVWYHVVYNEYWFCRDCRQDNGPVLFALVETGEHTIYAGLDWRKIPIPEMFQHHRCQKCGHLLQGHFLKL